MPSIEKFYGHIFKKDVRGHNRDLEEILALSKKNEEAIMTQAETTVTDLKLKIEQMKDEMFELRASVTKENQRCDQQMTLELREYKEYLEYTMYRDMKEELTHLRQKNKELEGLLSEDIKLIHKQQMKLALLRLRACGKVGGKWIDHVSGATNEQFTMDCK